MLYSGRENLPGEAKTMSIGEFVQLADDADVIDDYLVERTVRLAYVRAKQVRMVVEVGKLVLLGERHRVME